MRRTLTFPCAGHRLAATIDDGERSVGLFIVSGGNEVRAGPHRSMAMLAARIAAAGYPVWRFDRRGVGDSEGHNYGFRSAGPDIAAALSAFRDAVPQMRHIVAFGNCDAATALAVNAGQPFAALALANPWLLDGNDSARTTPPAIRAHYRARLGERDAWRRLLTGRVALTRLSRGLSAAVGRRQTTATAAAVAAGLRQWRGTLRFLIAEQDATGAHFLSHWHGPAFADLRRAHPDALHILPGSGHSFAGAENWLYDQLVTLLTHISAEHKSSYQ